ncbi:hypothetical protein, partial [Staphylococcus epidermidis]|uniref:hypothetical protein n=1 Tax=Staphylococcus epidermidis TaxID=1282 RepID=UPI001C93092D
ESNLLLIKQSIDPLQHELPPNLKTNHLLLLPYRYNLHQIKNLNHYFLQLTINQNNLTKKHFQHFLCTITNLPQIPNTQVNHIFQPYKNTHLHLHLINHI